MRILAITYAFAPLAVPASFRLLKWTRYLHECGHEVTVLAVDVKSIRRRLDTSLTKLIPSSVKVAIVESREETLLYRAMRKKSSWFLRRLHPYKQEWYGPARTWLQHADLSVYDLVLSCSQPPVSHLLGMWVKQKTALPWVAYFSDPWAHHPWKASVPPPVKHYDQMLEKRVMHQADVILFSSEETRRHTMDFYPHSVESKSCVLDHCFVPEWFEARSESHWLSRGAVNVVSMGSFYGPRRPDFLLQQLTKMKAQNRLPPSLRLHFFGHLEASCEPGSLWRELSETVVYGGALSYLESLSVMREADCLLLIDAGIDGSGPSLFFPSKLADYMGSGRPIVGVTPVNGASARILRHLGCPVVDSKDGAGIQEMVIRIAERLVPPPILESVASYDYRRVGTTLLSALTAARDRSR